LLYSDTDSMVYQIFTEDIYEWVKQNRQHFDLSDSIREDMKDNTNKKKLGMMKDELNTLPIKSFISLNPKCYSVLLITIKLKRMLKSVRGVKSNPKERNQTFKLY
jgi:hypothetical protein